MTSPCIICHNTANNETYTVNELQLGLGDAFEYQRCGKCGTMQLQNPPADFSKYYPNEDYYSFNMELKTSEKPKLLKRTKTEYLLFGRQPILGGLLSIGYKMNENYEWLKYLRATYDDAILDVGTGNGSLLSKFAELGFKNLTGIDPFINSSRDYGAIKILKKDIFDVDTPYDVIMLHHSLEHMPEPLKALQKVYSLLKPGGRALVRVPVMGNYGWQTYGTFWCGLDAPRHIFIPSEQGLKQLATDAGFVIDRFYYDSYDYVIWCSEQYKRGIPLHAPNSQAVNHEKSMFSKNDLKRFRKIMTEQNKKGNGDMAAMYLTKAK